MTGSIVMLVVLALLVVLNVKQIMWGAIMVVLIEVALASLAVGFVLAYRIPAQIEGAPSPVRILPFVMTAVLLITGGAAFWLGRHPNTIDVKQNLVARWAYLILGFFLFKAGTVLFLMSAYSPTAFGLGAPALYLGLTLFLIFEVCSVLLLYAASRLNSAVQPNLLRWIVFWMVFGLFNIPTILAFILIYAQVGGTGSIYPQQAALMTLGYLPMATLLVAITRNFVLRADRP